MTEPFPDNGRLPGKGLQLYGFGSRHVKLELRHKRHRWWKDNDVHLNRDCVTRAYFTKSPNAVVVAWYDLQRCGCMMMQLDRQSCLLEAVHRSWHRRSFQICLRYIFVHSFPCCIVNKTKQGRDAPNGCYKPKCLLLFKGWAELRQQINNSRCVRVCRSLRFLFRGDALWISCFPVWCTDRQRTVKLYKAHPSVDEITVLSVRCGLAPVH